MSLLRNITNRHGCYVVKVYRLRRCHRATALTLREAIIIRNDIESRFAIKKPWGASQRKPVVRTTAVIRQERRTQGLCIYCGDQATPAMATCYGCREVKRIKARAA